MEVLAVFFLGDDAARAVEHYPDLNAEPGSLQVAFEIGIGLEIDDILDEDIAFHMAPDITALGIYAALDIGGLADYQLALGVHRSVKCAVDADVRGRGHQTGHPRTLGYPAELGSLRYYLIFRHVLMFLLVNTMSVGSLGSLHNSLAHSGMRMD